MAQMLGLLELRKQKGTVRSSLRKENEIWMMRYRVPKKRWFSKKSAWLILMLIERTRDISRQTHLICIYHLLRLHI